MNKRFKKTGNNKKEEDAVFTAIKQNNLQVLQNIINNISLDFSKVWLGGYALLCAAINYRQFEIAMWLLTKDCKINRISDDDKSDTPLHLATIHNNNFLVDTLLKKGACITVKNINGETALLVSCRRQNLTITRLLLKDTTADISDNNLTTPLHIAVENQCIETITLLLSHKVNINAHTLNPNYKGFTALHIAIIKKNVEIVNILLKNGADIDAVIEIPESYTVLNNDLNGYVDYQDYNPLHLAIKIKDYNIVKLLLNHNADVNATVKHNGFTPLSIAVQNKDEEIVILLYQYKVNFCTKTKDGKNILHIALENNWCKLVEVLILNQADINDQTNEGETLLFMAVKMGDEMYVELLLNYNANVNVANYKNQTPLHIAAEFSEAIVKILLVHGAKVDEIDDYNETPLSIAVKYCNINIIKEILHYKPCINNIGNKLALAYATKNINQNYVQIIHILLDYGFLLSDENVIDTYLLNYLISQNQLQIIKHLLKYGVNIVASLNNLKESSFVQNAVKTENIELLKLLIWYGFDLNILDTYGKSAMDYATELDNSDIIDLLLENGAKINNFTLSLLVLVKNGNIQLCQKLLDYRNDVCVSDEFGTTPIHLAVWNTDYEFIHFLLCKQAHLNITDNCSNQITTSIMNGKTDFYTKEFKRQILTSPLHIAVGKKDKDICTMLLEYHADVNSKDGYGRTPLHIAAAIKSSNQKLIIKTLFQYCADINILDDFKRLPIYYLYNHSCVCSIAFQNQYGLYSECECDLYEENEVNDAITVFVKHIVILASMNRKVCTENYNIIQSNNFSKNLQMECLNEISKMKEKKLYHLISFYDIVSKDYNSLAALARNEDLIQAFQITNYAYEFPLYYDTIKEQFEKAQERNCLLERAVLLFTNLTNFTLPQSIIENIFDFLLLNDLRMIIAIYD
ncbi:ankyrin-3-like [Phymastichus coffea]|uniref:ankyrin-3-like n=1 Tax=Phymastichus coffea TaxID=108790 RepID=UPI00273B5F94|nr:ankyrin-3-like [Phymastichus coffea]